MSSFFSFFFSLGVSGVGVEAFVVVAVVVVVVELMSFAAHCKE